jgi:carboxypeptidase T
MLQKIHLVIQSNPDGRHVAETNRDLLRRKNMNPYSNISPCSEGGYGVDLNRKFPFQWGLDTGSSDDKCTQTYRGPTPASEPEVKAMVEYCKRIFPASQRKASPENQQQEAYTEDTTMGLFFGMHSAGNFMIWPWVSLLYSCSKEKHCVRLYHHINPPSLFKQSYEDVDPGNESGFGALASKYRHFNGYNYAGASANGFLYPASGVSTDWAYGALGAAAMTFELGTTFFQDCGYFHNSIAIDTNFRALTYAAKTAKAPYSIAKGPDVTSAFVEVNGNRLIVNVAASDSAWSSANHPTSQQVVLQTRAFVNEHPY